MADKKAKIEIGLEGANEVAEGASKILSSFTLMGVGLATAALKVKEVSDGLNKLKGIKPDVDISESVNKFRTFQEGLDVLQRQTGLKVDVIKKKLESVNLSTGIKLPELATSVSTFGEKTGDFQGSLDSLQQRAIHANNLAESLKEADEIGITLVRDLNVPPSALGKELQFIRDLAKDVGLAPKVLEQQIVAAGPILGRFDTTTEAKRREALTLVADINKGVDPRGAQERLEALTSGLTNNVQGLLTYDRLHGNKFHPIDPKTHRLSFEGLGEIQTYIKNTFKGNRRAQEQVAASFTGSIETAAAFLDFNFANIKRNANKKVEEEKPVESFGISKAKTEAAEEAYDREKGVLTTVFGQRGARAQERLSREAAEREKILSNLSPEEQQKFLEKERYRTHDYNPAKYGRTAGDLLDVVAPGSRKFLLGKTAKEFDAEPEVKYEGGDSAILGSIHGVLKSIDDKLTPKPDLSSSRAPSTGAQ